MINKEIMNKEIITFDFIANKEIMLEKGKNYKNLKLKQFLIAQLHYY